MPQIQVIERQPDPVAARIAETGNVVADALKQKQLLKMEQLKIRNEISQTENETRKIELEQQLKDVELFDKLQPIMQQLPDNERMPALLRFFGGDQERVLKFMQRGGSVFNYETPENKLKAEQAKKAQSEAEYMDLSSQALQQQLGVGGDQGQAPQAPQATPAQGRAQAVGGGGQGQMVTSGISFGPSGATINTINPEAERLKTIAGESAKKDLKQQDLATALTDFLQYEQQIPRHSGGVAEGIKQAANLRYQSVAQKDKGIANAFYTKSKDLAKYVARRVDVGNLAIYEQKVAQNLVPTDYDSSEAAAIKNRYLIQLATLTGEEGWEQNQESLKRVKDLLNQADIFVKSQEDNPRARTLKTMNAQTQAPQQEDFSSMSAEELQRIVDGGI